MRVHLWGQDIVNGVISCQMYVHRTYDIIAFCRDTVSMVQQDSETGTQAASTASGRVGALDSLRDLPLFRGAIFGLLAFVVGYALTLLLARVAGALIGAREPLEFAGLVFFGTHFVSETADLPTGIQALSALGEMTSTIPKVVYYLVPVVVLTAGSYLMVNRLTDRESRSPEAGAKAGMTLVVGYLPLVVLGALLFSIPIYTAAPFASSAWQADLVSAVVLAGLVYPLAFGALGGYLAVVAPSERFSGSRGDDGEYPSPGEESSQTTEADALSTSPERPAQ